MKNTTESVGTPAAQWRLNGEADPFGLQYECQVDELTLGQFSNNELAARLRNLWSEGFMMIGVITAVKERIRWLSRRLYELEGDEGRTENNLSRSELLMGDKTDDELANLAFMEADAFTARATDFQKAGAERIEWLVGRLAAIES